VTFVDILDVGRSSTVEILDLRHVNTTAKTSPKVTNAGKKNAYERK
jgi:hypothetical protein